MRRQIGEHMLRSLHTAAHCTTIVEADMSAIEMARGRLSYLPFVARATIAALREFEGSRSAAFDDPRAVERLQNAVIEGLKDFEFALARKLNGAQPGGPALGTRSPVPEEFRGAVEEYYRSLAGGRREKEK